MDEGKFKRGIVKEVLDIITYDKEKKIAKIVDKVKEEFYIALTKCREMGDYRELIEFGLKWFGVK